MHFYFSPSNDPYYNLALEEYLLTQSQQDILLLYINKPSLVVGRFQVPYKEIDVAYINKENIQLARRSSGGGTVFHDLGNLNYAFIAQCQDNIDNYYDIFNKVTVEILEQLGYQELTFQRNNIFCQEKKISGVAQYKRSNRIVHHGTLLVNANLKQLRSSFTKKDYYISKGVASVSSSVSNLSEIKTIGMEEVIAAYKNKNQSTYVESINKQEVSKLKEKYASIEWILGKSPKYSIKKESMEISVEQGRISDIKPKELASTRGEWHNLESLKGKVSDPKKLF